MNPLPDEFIENLKYQPETYKTMLKDEYDNRNTLTNVVRKKVCKMVKFNMISCSVLDGTRFGEKIFFNSNKQYFIVTLRRNGVFKYYYCFDIMELQGNKLVLVNTFCLDSGEWKDIGDLTIDSEDIRRWF